MKNEQTLDPITISLIGPARTGKTTLLAAVMQDVTKLLPEPFKTEAAEDTEQRIKSINNAIEDAIEDAINTGKVTIDPNVIPETLSVTEYHWNIICQDQGGCFKVTQPITVIDGCRLDGNRLDGNRLDTSMALWIPIEALMLMEATTTQAQGIAKQRLQVDAVTNIAVQWAKSRNGKPDEPAELYLAPMKCETYASKPQVTQELYKKFKAQYDNLIHQVQAECPRCKVYYTPVESIGCIKLQNADFVSGTISYLINKPPRQTGGTEPLSAGIFQHGVDCITKALEARCDDLERDLKKTLFGKEKIQEQITSIQSLLSKLQPVKDELDSRFKTQKVKPQGPGATPPPPLPSTPLPPSPLPSAPLSVEDDSTGGDTQEKDKEKKPSKKPWKKLFAAVMIIGILGAGGYIGYTKIIKQVQTESHTEKDFSQMISDYLQNGVFSEYTQINLSDITHDDPAKNKTISVQGRFTNFPVEDRSVSGEFTTKIAVSIKRKLPVIIGEADQQVFLKADDVPLIDDAAIRNNVNMYYNNPLDISIKERVPFLDHVKSTISFIVERNKVIYVQAVFEKENVSNTFNNGRIRISEALWKLNRAETISSTNFPDKDRFSIDLNDGLFKYIDAIASKEFFLNKGVKETSYLSEIVTQKLEQAANGKIVLNLDLIYFLDLYGLIGSYEWYKISNVLVSYQFEHYSNSWTFISLDTSNAGIIK